MALNTGNKQNRFNLFNNAPVGFDVEWNEQIAMNFLNEYMDIKDWQFVQDVWNLLEELWIPSQALYRKLTGFTPAGVVRVPFIIVKDNQEIYLEGGYFPLSEDKRQKQIIKKDEDVLEGDIKRQIYPKDGFMKKRTGASYPLELNLELLKKHMENVAHNLAFRETIIDLNRVINNKEYKKVIINNNEFSYSFKNLVRDNLGADAYIQLQDWLQNASTGLLKLNDAIKWTDGARWLKRNTAATYIFFNVKILTQNLANFLLYENAINNFGKKEVFKGMIGAIEYNTNFLFNNKKYAQTRNFVYEKSSLMKDRAFNPDYQLDISFKKDNKLKNFAVRMISFSDEIFAIPMWLEAYNKFLADSGKVKFAIQQADKLVERSIGTGRKYDTASLMRAKDMRGLFVMFKNFWNTEYNRWYKEVGILKTDADYLRFSQFVANRFAFIILSAFLSFEFPKEKDFEDWLRFVAREVSGYSLGQLPFWGDIAKTATEKAFKLRDYTFDYKLSPALAPIESVINTTEATAKFLKGDLPLEKFIEKSMQTVAFATATPKKLIDAFFNTFDILFNGLEFTPEMIVRRVRKKKSKLKW